MSTSEGVLEPRLVEKIEGRFFVPSYQRGYRWGSDEVTRLLDDIAEAEGKPYFLQPVVVKAIPDGRWELVDGQQRLTTLYLIFGHLRTPLPMVRRNYSIEYETRGESAVFLEEPSRERSQENIDFFHIHAAHLAIDEWFNAHSNPTKAAMDLYRALSETVSVIWYEAPTSADSSDLFRRLNIGRIPLTDSELVKGLLLHRGADRAAEIAAAWDGIERDLRNPELWAFLTGSPSPQATHFDLLLDTLADGPTGRGRPLFHTFETLRVRIQENPYGFWDDVVDLHSMVLGWYEDRATFHKVGFLVANGVPFHDLVRLMRHLTKSAFQTALDGRIREKLNLSTSDLGDIGYEKKRRQAESALLLMNVLTVQGAASSQERYSFREHAAGRWSLEHIHAQNADDLTTMAQWLSWLTSHINVLERLQPSLDPATQEKRERLMREANSILERQALATPKAPVLTENVFADLQVRILPFFTDDGEEDLHSLSNLALLSGADNSALGNAAFEVKRREILRRDRDGSYLPVCTRNVFLKYYSPPGDRQLHLWSPEDRAGYLAEMTRVLSPYLKSESA